MGDGESGNRRTATGPRSAGAGDAARVQAGSPMPVVVDLPYRVQCGAAPSPRGQSNCDFCGAVLPWELWDELSRARVEVTPVDEAAIARADACAPRPPR